MEIYKRLDHKDVFDADPHAREALKELLSPLSQDMFNGKKELFQDLSDYGLTDEFIAGFFYGMHIKKYLDRLTNEVEEKLTQTLELINSSTDKLPM